METSIVIPEFVDARIGPRGSLETLSQEEIDQLLDSSQRGLYPLFRRCVLAVLNSGSETDDAREIFERYRDFGIEIVRHPWGVKLEIRNAPAMSFVDGEMIRGIKEHVFAVLRDVVFISNEINDSTRFDLKDPQSITNAVFHILRNAHVLNHKAPPNLVVCWGGHSISREEYDYTKKVGYELGLRGLDVCTGCGPGAMKGPMKGANIGHAKQRIAGGRYIGITEPGIIAAESPNPIVNQLVIMPDMEKRLEAFVRVAHAIVIFPGGVGTAEEFLFLLGVLLDPRNRDVPLPVVLTGPPASAAYFAQIDEFIGATLGREAQQRYQLSIGDPAAVATILRQGMRRVRDFRHAQNDAYYFNWRLHLDMDFQQPFHATHESMAALALYRDQPPARLAAGLRKAFSGLVTGNVKDDGIRAIESRGPFELSGDREVMTRLDRLLAAFVEQGRMKLPGRAYQPCYRLVV